MEQSRTEIAEIQASSLAQDTERSSLILLLPLSLTSITKHIQRNKNINNPGVE
jgi:hypothetical protein